MKIKLLLNTFLLFTSILWACTSIAAPLNATNIGGMWTTTPISTAASQALTGFRGAFTPMNIGMVVGSYVIISTIGDGVNNLRAQMGSNLPPEQLPPVPGWTNSETPPATQSPVQGYILTDGTNTATGATREAVCSSVFSMEGSPAGYTVRVDYVSGSYKCNYVHTSGAISLLGIINTNNICPSGYTGTTTCTLTNASAAQWPSDGIQSLKMQGNNFIYDPRDPDNDGMTGIYNPFGRTGTDQYKNPVKETLTPNATGGVDYQRDTEGVSPSTGEPMVQRDKFSTDSQGQVISKSSTQYGNSTINNVNTSNVSTTGQIDTSSLAQESTAQAILSQLQPGTPADLTNVDSAVKTIDDQVQVDLATMPKDLLNNPTPMLQLPQYWNYASGVCYPVEFDAGRFGKVSLERFCEIYDEHIRQLIVFIFAVIACLHVFHFWKETIIESMPS